MGSTALVSKSGIAFLPGLLLLAPFLATLPLFVPNLRVMRDVCENPVAFGDIAISMMVSCLLVSLALTALAFVRGIEWEGPTRGLLVAPAVIYVLCQVGLWVAGVAHPQASPLTLWGVGLPMGASLVPLLVAWGSCYDLDFRNVLFYGALACVGSSIMALVISLLTPVAAGVVWCLCALIGAASPVALLARRMTGGVAGEQGEGAVPRAGGMASGRDEVAAGGGETASLGSVFADFASTQWLPLLGLLVCMCCSCMTEAELNGRVVRGELVGLIVAAALAIVLCCVRTKTPLVLLVERLAAPALIACGIILSSLPPIGSVDGVSPLAAYYVFVPMVFVSLYALASVMAMQGLSRFFVAGVTLAACCLAMLVGSALARTAYFWSAMGPYVRLAMSAYYAVVLVDLACTAWRLTVRGPQGGAEAFDATGQHETLEESISRRMGALAQRFGLTSRESEVCTYLWRGYNSGHIAKALLISGNTARTHIRNIYRKLDVSSRGELLALLSEATDTEERK